MFNFPNIPVFTPPANDEAEQTKIVKEATSTAERLWCALYKLADATGRASDAVNATNLLAVDTRYIHGQLIRAQDACQEALILCGQLHNLVAQ